MKLSPQIYAKLLLESLSVSPPARGGAGGGGSTNIKLIARNFWHLLQKNKQYKDLSRILEALEIESAKSEGKTIAKVYSEKELNDTELKEIEKKLQSKSPNSSFLIHNSVKNGTTGIVVKIEDKILDLSAEDKINRLRKEIQ